MSDLHSSAQWHLHASIPALKENIKQQTMQVGHNSLLSIPHLFPRAIRPLLLSSSPTRSQCLLQQIVEYHLTQQRRHQHYSSQSAQPTIKQFYTHYITPITQGEKHTSRAAMKIAYCLLYALIKRLHFFVDCLFAVSTWLSISISST